MSFGSIVSKPRSEPRVQSSVLDTELAEPTIGEVHPDLTFAPAMSVSPGVKRTSFRIVPKSENDP
jgi:hypothetical protein